MSHVSFCCQSKPYGEESIYANFVPFRHLSDKTRNIMLERLPSPTVAALVRRFVPFVKTNELDENCIFDVFAPLNGDRAMAFAEICRNIFVDDQDAIVFIRLFCGLSLKQKTALMGCVVRFDWEVAALRQYLKLLMLLKINALFLQLAKDQTKSSEQNVWDFYCLVAANTSEILNRVNSLFDLGRLFLEKIEL